MGHSYNINTENKDEIVFTEAKGVYGCFFFICVIIGLIALGVAVYLFKDYQTTGEPISQLFYVALGFGISFTTAGVFLRLASGGNPHEMIFDNVNCFVKITQKAKNEIKSAEIPYRDILMFDYRAESSSNSTSGRTNYNYVVFWRKKDGSIWDIRSFSNQEKASGFVSELKDLIKIEKDTGYKFSPRLPKGIKMEKEGANIVFEWKNKFTPSSLFFIAILMGISLAAHGIIPDDLDDTTYSNFFYPFFFVVVGFIFSVFMYGIIKNLLYTFQLKVGKEFLQYIYKTKKSDKIAKEIPISEIKSVSFDLKTVVGGSSLQIMDEKQFETTQRAMDGKVSLSDIGDIFKSSFGILKLNIEHLDVVDKVHLESILQIIIREQGGNVF